MEIIMQSFDVFLSEKWIFLRWPPPTRCGIAIGCLTPLHNALSKKLSFSMGDFRGMFIP
jgi:hypothetical protein